MPSQSPDDRLRWIWRPLPRGARAEPLARDWLAGELDWQADALPIRRDPRGRPQLDAPLQGFDCNWSHSGEGLLVVLGEGVKVGADIEWRRPRTRALELAHRYFAAAEAEWLAGLVGEARDEAFLRLWCAKEAVLKAHGHGLAFGLDRLAFIDTPAGLLLHACDPALGRPGQWALRELVPAPGYLGAVAVQRADG